MGTFDNLIQPIPVKKKPALHPASGTEKDILNTVMYEHIKGSNSKPHFNVRFRGLVLYTSILSYDSFMEKYDSTFVEYCSGASLKATGKEPGKSEQTSNLKVVEAIVYIQELCACLPQPSTNSFFKHAMKTSEPVKSGKEEEKLKNSQKGSMMSAKELDQIRRYPKAYLILRNGLKEFKAGDVVNISFPYNFDYSYGVIVNQAPV